MIVSIEGLLGRDLKAAGDEDVAQLTDDKCRKALCMMLKLHAHQCVSNVTSEARYSVRQAGYDHLDDVSEKYEKLAKQLAAKVDRLEEEGSVYLTERTSGFLRACSVRTAHSRSQSS